MFSIIAAIGKNNELGKKNGLVFKIKEDMRYFRDKTMGHKVVMGSNTWNSLPAKLNGRENIVISTREFDGPDLIIHDAKDFIQKNLKSDEEIFIIGGGTVYMQFLPFAKNIYLTEVDAEDKEAVTYFPEFNKDEYDIELVKKGSENGLNYSFFKYTRK